jgi:Xaa-Pro dipeptidase
MNRLERLTARVHEHGLGALLVTTPANTFYLSRFAAASCIRPTVVVACDAPVLIVSQAEEEHARERSAIGDIRTYSDRQVGGAGGMSSMHLALGLALEALRDYGIAGSIGFEADGLSAEGFFTLRGRTSVPVVPTRGVVERLRMVKDDEEIGLIRQACALADHGMGVAVAASWPGNSELAVVAEAEAAVLREGLRRHPSRRLDVRARSVSGPRTALPYAPPSARRLEPGDAVACGVACRVDGYRAAHQRTLFVERAADGPRRLFEVVERAAAAALAAIRPGTACREVDRAARAVVEEAGCGQAFLHRTGAGLGITAGEHPVLGPGDDTPLEVGMVVTVEPGLYVPGVGGVRHTDTVLVTAHGPEILTPHPRDMEGLVVRA